ncbi:MAG: chitinase [Lachnospiraceae bacterium]|nr:chitinase [Lachnospiraceae bacterium]
MENFEDHRKYREVRKKHRRRRRRPVREYEDNREVDRDLLRSFGHKVLAFLIAVALIVLVFMIAFAGRIKQNIDSGQKMGVKWFLALLYPEKYSYATNMADLNEIFSITSPEDTAIVLGDEIIASRARYLEGHVYFSLETVKELFTDRFYYNEDEKVLIYSTSTDMYKAYPGVGKPYYELSADKVDTDYVPALYAKDGLCLVAADYVKLFADLDYEFFENPKRVQIYLSGGNERVAVLTDATSVRHRGGIKSDIICKLDKGAEVRILETMETWSKIKTKDSFIGYVENEKLDGYRDSERKAPSGAYKPKEDYPETPSIQRVMLGFHQLSNEDNGKGLAGLCENASGMNVIAPTWFFLDGSEDGYRDISNSSYVERAHDLGLKVWPLLEDMSNSFDEYAFFSSGETRAEIIEKLTEKLEKLGADGLNVDCEKIDSKTAPHFVQFLRELSISLHKAGLELSIDNYVPNEGNRYYNLKEQGLVADYCIMMGYDEHWGTSPEAGSVASIGFVETGITDTIKQGVPESKFVLAVPFFTRIWKTENGVVSSEAVGLGAAKSWLSDHEIEPAWHDDMGQYYGEYEEDGVLYQMWLEDGESLKAKISVAKTYGVNGVAAWRLGLENEGIWALIDAEFK